MKIVEIFFENPPPPLSRENLRSVLDSARGFLTEKNLQGVVEKPKEKAEYGMGNAITKKTFTDQFESNIQLRRSQEVLLLEKNLYPAVGPERGLD